MNPPSPIRSKPLSRQSKWLFIPLGWYFICFPVICFLKTHNSIESGFSQSVIVCRLHRLNLDCEVMEIGSAAVQDFSRYSTPHNEGYSPDTTSRFSNYRVFYCFAFIFDPVRSQCGACERVVMIKNRSIRICLCRHWIHTSGCTWRLFSRKRSRVKCLLNCAISSRNGSAAGEISIANSSGVRGFTLRQPWQVPCAHQPLWHFRQCVLSRSSQSCLFHQRNHDRTQRLLKDHT